MAKVTVRKDKNFTVISNDIFKDTRLSFKAKGLLTTMLSCPKNWNYTIEGLSKLSTDGKASIRSALNELEEYGYLERKQLRNEKGAFTDTEYIVYEQPMSDFRKTDKPTSDKRTQLNNNILNTYELNTDNKNYALFFDKNKGRVHACFGAKQGASPSYSDKQLEERLTDVILKYAYDVENANVIFDIFMYFYKEYELRFGRKHPILSDKTYEKIIKSYYEPAGDEISNTDIDISEHRKMVDLYFDTDYNKRGNYGGEVDKSLQHFFSGQIRNHLLMRVRDCEDYV